MMDTTIVSLWTVATPTTQTKKKRQVTSKIIPIYKPNPQLLKVTPIALPKRGITKETSELFGYGMSEYRRQPVQVATYKDQKGNDVAQHIRFRTRSLYG